jgi:hypothetical protein
MTEPTVTQADIDAAAAYWGNDNPPLELRDAFARHRITSAPAGEVEPVAWMYEWRHIESTEWSSSVAKVRPTSPFHGIEIRNCQPLYAHPPAPADLVEASTALLNYEGHHAWCGHGEDMDKPCVCGLIAAQDRLRAALAKHGGA